MNTGKALSLGAVCMLAMHAIAHAETVTFERIPLASGANDISPDGRWIVGDTDLNGDFFVDGTYIFDTTAPIQPNQALVNPNPRVLHQDGLSAIAVSNDGHFIAGVTRPLGTFHEDEVAAIWSAATGRWTTIGYDPTVADSCGTSVTSSYEISADGSTICGLVFHDGCEASAFRWTAATGMVKGETLALGGNRASVISADGSILAGFANGNFGRTPTFWNNGVGTVLDADDYGEFHGISDDGTVLLAEWNFGAAKWTQADGYQLIGNGSVIPGWTGIPTDIAQNGTVVGFDILLGNRLAWIQPNGTGPLIHLFQYVADHGGVIDQNDWDQQPNVCQAISADGTKIIGHNMWEGAWLVTITPDEPATCDEDIAPPGGDGQVSISDITQVLSAFGQPCNGCPEDIAPPGGDGQVSVADITQVLSAFGLPCGPQVPTGSCCFYTGGCSNVTALACEEQGGYWTQGGSCAKTVCPANEDGACCLPDESCAEVKANDCPWLGGVFESGATCTTASCSSSR